MRSPPRHLLIACDYDGTIAPLVDDPMTALPLRETSVALRGLAALAQTDVAVISGRSLRDLAALSRLPAEIHLVGSHGSEFDIDFALDLDPALQERRSELLDALGQLVADHPKLSLEKKPASVAVHYRALDEDEIETVVAEIERIHVAIGKLDIRHGKKVCELLLIPTDKGKALSTVRATVGATAVLFLGDDVTDEYAFRTLHGPDVGVKVGEGETAAPFRVDSPEEVAILLAALSTRRADWLAGAGVTPIDEHSMLSDQRTAAIVTPMLASPGCAFPASTPVRSSPNSSARPAPATSRSVPPTMLRPGGRLRPMSAIHSSCARRGRR